MSGDFLEWCSYVLRATIFIPFSGSNSCFSKSKKDNSKNISRSLSANSRFAFHFSQTLLTNEDGKIMVEGRILPPYVKSLINSRVEIFF